MKKSLVGLAVLAALTGVWLQRQPSVLAQSTAPGSGAASQPFEQRFWNWLQQVQYRNWSPLPGGTTTAYEGQSPHGARLKMYVNRTAAANPAKPPVGSILVTENFAADGTTLTAVTVMYRSAGFDPEHSDWYWARYEADGRVSRTDGRALTGRVKACIECHSGADGGDFVFAND